MDQRPWIGSQDRPEVNRRPRRLVSPPRLAHRGAVKLVRLVRRRDRVRCVGSRTSTCPPTGAQTRQRTPSATSSAATGRRAAAACSATDARPGRSDDTAAAPRGGAGAAGLRKRDPACGSSGAEPDGDARMPGDLGSGAGALGAPAPGRLEPDPHGRPRPARSRSAGLAHQVAELAEAIGARVEVGREVGEPRADRAQATQPSSLSICAITRSRIGMAALGGCSGLAAAAGIGSLAGACGSRFSV